MSTLVDQVTVDLIANVTQYLQGLQQAGSATQQVANTANSAGAAVSRFGDSAERDFKRASAGAEGLDKTLNTVKNTMLGLASIEVGRRVAGDIIQATNAYEGYKRGLEAASGSQQKAASDMAFVRTKSYDLGLSLQNNYKDFTQLAAASRGTTLAGQGTRDIFTAVAEASRVLNLSAEKTSGALLAIQQMISKGNVQSEELRGQLGERLPGAFQIAAQAMGVTTAQLGKMLEQGQVTADVMLPKLAAKLHELYGAAARDAANSPAAAFERLKNSIFELEVAIGNAGFMRALANGAEAITSALLDLVKSGSMDYIVFGITAIGAAIVAAFAGRALTAVGEWAAGLRSANAVAAGGAAVAAELAAGHVANTAAATADAKAQQADAAATAANTQAQLAFMNTQRAAVVQRLAYVEVVVAEARAELAAATAAGPQSFALKIRQEAEAKLTAALAARSAVMGELAALGQIQAKTEAQLIAETNALTAATGRLAAAQNAQAAAQAVANTAGATAAAQATFTAAAVRGLKDAGSSLLAMLGGWPGVLLLAAGGLVYLATRATETEKEVERLAKQTEEASKRVLGFKDMLNLLAKGTEPAKKSLLELKEAQLQQLNAQHNLEKSYGGYTDAIDLTLEKIVVLREEVRKLREAEAQFALTNLKAEFSDAARFIREAIDAALNWRSTISKTLNIDTAGLDKEAAQMEEHAAKMNKTKVQYYEMKKAQELQAAAAKAGAKEGSEAYKILAEAADKAYTRVLKAAAADDEANKVKKNLAKGIRDVAAAEREAEQQKDRAAAMTLKLTLLELKLAGDIGGPVVKAHKEYEAVLARLNYEKDKDIGSGADRARVEKLAEQAAQAAARARDAELQRIRERQAIAPKVLESMRQEIAMIGLTNQQQEIAKTVQQTINDLKREGVDFNGQYYESLEELTRVLNEQAPAFAAQVAALVKQREEMQKVQASWEEVKGAWVSAANTMKEATIDWMASGFNNTKDYLKRIEDSVRQAVARMLWEWAKTKIIGYFTGGGQGASGWGQAAGAFFGGGGGGWIGAAAAVAGAASGGGDDTIFSESGGTPRTGGYSYNGGAGTNYGSIINYGTMLSGSGSVSGFIAGAGGAYGPPTAAQGAYASAAPWAGAVAGAFYGAQQGDGGIGTVGSTAAGAVAGYYAAGAITAGYAAAATTGAAAGVSAGLAAIPVIGWIAIIALIVDKISGGKVFGTKYRPEQMINSYSWGAEGGDVSNRVLEWKYIGGVGHGTAGKLLHGGWGDKQRRWKDIEASEEQLAMVDKLFKNMLAVIKSAAKALETDAIPMINAAFESIQQYDKKGRPKGDPRTYSTFYGVRREESFEDFQKRFAAEAIIAQVNAVAVGAHKIAEAYRNQVDELLDVAQTMLKAEADLRHGQTLLTGQGNLEEIIDWLEEQRLANESLAETYDRLMQATQAYRDLMDKVRDSLDKLWTDDDPVSQMVARIKDFQKQLADNIKALNDAAIAAGLAGAAEADLAAVRRLFTVQIGKMQEDFFKGIDQSIESLAVIHTPVGDFRQAMLQIQRTMAENIGQANALARALGQQGASEQQLARIHELAARQAAAAIQQLINVGQAQSRSLYGGAFTIADLDADIASLEERAENSAKAVQNFGSAMTSTANAATEAMNLLLGTLSPFNDQQKLQIALGGLANGSATPEQVLEIGRRLYASTSAYTDLFNQVQGMAPRRSGGGGGGAGGKEIDPDDPRYKPLTAEEAAKLEELKKQREEMLARQRLDEARGLADTVAEISRVQGISFEEVAKMLKFSLDDLAKDMGMSREELDKYLLSAQANATLIPDSITVNTDRMIAVLRELFTENTRTVPMPRDHNAPVGGDRVNPTNNDEDRRARTIVDATDRTTDAVRDVDRTLRGLGSGGGERSTRYNTPILIR